MSQFVTSQGLAAMINAGNNVVNLGDAIGKPIAQGLATRYANQRQDELLAQQTQRQDQLIADKYQREDDKLAAAQQLSEQQRQDAILASQFANVADEAQFSELMNAGVQNGTIDDDDIAQINQAYNMAGLAGVNQLGQDLLRTSQFADNFLGTSGRATPKITEGDFLFKDKNGNLFSQQTYMNANNEVTRGILTDVTGRGLAPEGELVAVNAMGQGAADIISAEGKKEETKALAGSSTAVAEAEADKARMIAQAKSQQEASDNAFKKANSIRGQLSKIDKAIDALSKGAKSGIIQKRFPSFSKATIQLEEAAKQLGIEVINSATFGALSAPELQLALDTALPLNLDEDDLKQYLTDKRDAMKKLQGEIIKMGKFLAKKGNTLDKWMGMQVSTSKDDFTLSDEDNDLVNKYL